MAKKNNIGKDFINMARQMQNLVSNQLPNEAMAKAEELVQESFDKEQYQGEPTASKWKKRKKEATADRSDRRGLLVQSGRLRASIMAKIKSGNIVAVSAGYDVDKWNLAQIHNEGLDPQPVRKFMPKPGEAFKELDEHLEAYLDKELNSIFK